MRGGEDPAVRQTWKELLMRFHLGKHLLLDGQRQFIRTRHILDNNIEFLDASGEKAFAGARDQSGYDGCIPAGMDDRYAEVGA